MKLSIRILGFHLGLISIGISTLYFVPAFAGQLTVLNAITFFVVGLYFVLYGCGRCCKRKKHFSLGRV